jgi:2-oxo-4-hydroxy-4-carboxy-5-ureidoimidazoline decarboxylase
VSAASKLDAASHDEAAAALKRCCGASRWVHGMLARRPFGNDARLHAVADEVWAAMDRDDVLEALSHHPEIGASLDALRERFSSTATWAAGEQASVAQADEATLVALRDGNVRYRERFGHIFVVCATGKGAGQMLALLQARIDNAPADELRIAAAEQAKITRLRLEKIDA